ALGEQGPGVEAGAVEARRAPGGAEAVRAHAPRAGPDFFGVGEGDRPARDPSLQGAVFEVVEDDVRLGPGGSGERGQEEAGAGERRSSRRRHGGSPFRITADGFVTKWAKGGAQIGPKPAALSRKSCVLGG